MKTSLTILQKTIWMRYLIIGISLILFSINSCGKKTVEERHYIEYRYINKSNYDVSINIWQNLNDSLYQFHYSLTKNEVLEQNIELNSGSISGLIIYSDSLKVTFSGNTHKVFRVLPKDTSQYNLLLKENYQKTKIHDNEEEYRYVITDKDYLNAQ